MLARMANWERIREQFSKAEKFQLNAATSGETICLSGCVLDEVKLGGELSEKLRAALKV